VGFFRTVGSADPDEERIRAYVADGRVGFPREDLLFSAAVLRVAETPVAAANRVGTPLTGTDLVATSEVIRTLMVQDRDLSAKIVRKAARMVSAVVSGMPGDFGRNFGAAFATMGIDVGDGAGIAKLTAGSADRLADSEREPAQALAELVTVLVVMLAQPSEQQRAHPGWSFYSDLYSGASGEDVEGLAYDLIAWIAVMVARLLNKGQIAPTPVFSSDRKRVPRLTEPGWYPAPNKKTELVDGVAPVQRYWDGSSWTDRIRIRDGRDWQIASVPLHDPQA
jgi:hypothetical protein